MISVSSIEFAQRVVQVNYVTPIMFSIPSFPKIQEENSKESVPRFKQKL